MIPAGLSLLLVAAAEPSLITGTAACRERILVSPRAVFEATLEEVSRADTPAAIVARQRLSPAGRSPFAIRISYDPARIQKGRRYVVRATLTDGATRWSTEATTPVLTQGAGPTVQLLLKQVPAPKPPTGTFEGLLPCADCPGMKTRLTLAPDRTYHRRSEHEDRPGGSVDEIGSFVLTADGKMLALEGGREGAQYFAITTADRLTQLDAKGDPIATPANLDLVRVATPGPVEPRLVLEGLVTYTADAAVFEECRTRRKMPVANEGEYKPLESAYAGRRDTPGQPAHAVVEGRIASRANATGPAKPTLVVERFVELRPGAACAPRFAAATFESTYWRLVELDGAPLLPSEAPPQREAHLIFGADPTRVIGADGCNGMVGEYEADDISLKLGKLAGTMMACPSLGNRDQQFRQALARASSYRVLGPALQLRDAAGTVVALFAAVPRDKVVPRK